MQTVADMQAEEAELIKLRDEAREKGNVELADRYAQILDHVRVQVWECLRMEA